MSARPNLPGFSVDLKLENTTIRNHTPCGRKSSGLGLSRSFDLGVLLSDPAPQPGRGKRCSLQLRDDTDAADHVAMSALVTGVDPATQELTVQIGCARKELWRKMK